MGTGALQTSYHWSLREPASFWGEAAEAVHWYKKWDKVLDDSRQPFYRRFVGGQVNTCYNALDLHVDEGHGDHSALIYDSPVTNSIKTFTYRQLRDKVAVFAGALARLGVTKRLCGCLYADDPRGGRGHACVCPSGRSPLSGFRWICRK